MSKRKVPLRLARIVVELLKGLPLLARLRVARAIGVMGRITAEAEAQDAAAAAQSFEHDVDPGRLALFGLRGGIGGGCGEEEQGGQGEGQAGEGHERTLNVGWAA